MLTDLARTPTEELIARDTFQGMSDKEIKRVINYTLAIAMTKRNQRELARSMDRLGEESRKRQRSANLDQMRINKRLEDYYKQRRDALIEEMERIRNGKEG